MKEIFDVEAMKALAKDVDGEYLTATNGDIPRVVKDFREAVKTRNEKTYDLWYGDTKEPVEFGVSRKATIKFLTGGGL